MVDGVLLVYHRPDAPWIKDASTVMEHVNSFAAHSRNRIWQVNTDLEYHEEQRTPATEDREVRRHA